MAKLKYLLAAAGASATLVLGLAAPVGASETGGDVDVNIEHVEDSPSNDDGNQANNGGVVQNVNGDCSAAFVSDIYQSQNNTTEQENENKPDQENTNVNVPILNLENENDQNSENNSSSNQNNNSSNSQSNSGPSFEADCSNVTNVTQAAQVRAPKGGVGAGAGAAASTTSVLGLFGSVASAGLGLGLRFFKKGA